MRGTARLQQQLRNMARQFPAEVGRALYQETEIETTEAKKRTPVDTGALRSTVHTEGPTVQGRAISTAIVAGGPSAPYALAVHEDLEAFHPVGQAKYIESVINESASHIAARVVQRLDLKKLI